METVKQHVRMVDKAHDIDFDPQKPADGLPDGCGCDTSAFHHCDCKACADREMMINTIYSRYCMLIEAANWFENEGNLGLTVSPGQNPLMALIHIWRDLANPVQETGVPSN